MIECYHNKFSASGGQCSEPAVWMSAHLHNIIDGWTWCIQHAPHPDFRTMVRCELREMSMQEAKPPDAHTAYVVRGMR